MSVSNERKVPVDQRPVAADQGPCVCVCVCVRSVRRRTDHEGLCACSALPLNLPAFMGQNQGLLQHMTQSLLSISV